MTIGKGATDLRAIWRLETSSGPYHGFGVWQRDGNLVAHHFVNGLEIQRQVLMTGLTPNIWYGLELAVDDGAGMRATVWKESEPGTRYEARFEMPRGISWRFHAWSRNGVMSLDEYAEETPGGGSADSRIVGKHYEYDSVSAQTTKRYYVGGRLIATRTGSSVRYVQPDHLGSTTTLTDPAGNVVAKEKYSAFGERRRGESPLITDQLYTGQRYNALSSLYHYSDGTSAGRFYDPLLGRFVSADSVTPPGSQGLNRYAYALNSPLVYDDPDGHCPLCMYVYIRHSGRVYRVIRSSGKVLDEMSDQTAETLNRASDTVSQGGSGWSGGGGGGGGDGGGGGSEFEDVRSTSMTEDERSSSADLGRSLNRREWQVGDLINMPDDSGNYPSWNLVRSRYWQNRAATATPGEFSAANLARMSKKTDAQGPRARVIVRKRATGEEIEILVTKELHHRAGREGPDPHNPDNIMELWPWEHERMDPNRHLDYDFLRFK